jgi:glycosyltransferase involved in cell wall biosynthesis
MKIYAICLAKNEVDIIEHCLRQASEWAEKIIVYDNGSTDGTWELVQRLAAVNPAIIAWKQDGKPFNNYMRGEAFEAHRHLAQKGDWWCFRLDADELYPQDPRPHLLATASHYHVVVKESIEYVLTHEDLAEHDFTQLLPVPFALIRYYVPHTYSEVRFFRHRDRLRWEVGATMPRFLGITSPHRVKVHHYQYRSIPQVKRRMEVRAEARRHGHPNWQVVDAGDWRKMLFHRRDCLCDAGTGTRAPHGSINKFLPPWYIYWVKRLVFGLGILP